MFAAIEAKIKAYWNELTGEARADLEKALDDVKARAAQFGPLIAQAKADVGQVIAEVEPEVKAAVEARLAQLAEDAAKLLAEEL